MALQPSSGSLPPTLVRQPGNETISPDASTPETPTLETRVSDRRYVKDSTTNRNSLNLDRNADVVNSLKGYAAGTPIEVTFYHQIDPLTDDRAVPNDYSPETDCSHMAFQRINRFELRLQNGLDYTYLYEETSSRLLGVALCLPGFNPYIGDVFTYPVANGKLTLCKINQAPTRKSWHTGTSYEVQFEVQGYFDVTDLANLEAAVQEVSWFSKQRFLTEPGALLTSDEFVMVQQLQLKYKELVGYYLDTFFDRATYQSYVRADGCFDPYVVEFLNRIIPFSDIQLYPQQLLPSPPDWNRTLWAKLLNPSQVPTSRLLQTYEKVTRTLDSLTTQINALINRPYVHLVADDYTGGVTYPYGVYTYSESISEEQTGSVHDVITRYFMEHHVHGDLVLALANAVYGEDPEDQFYLIPIYLFFMQVLDRGLTLGISEVTYDAVTPPQ